MLKDEGLKLGSTPIALVHDAMIMNGTGCTLDSTMGTEVEVELKRMGTSSLHQSSRNGIFILVATFGEEADVVALAGNDHSELGNLVVALCGVHLFHSGDFVLKHRTILAL